MDKRELVSDLLAKRAEARTSLDALLETAKGETRGLNDEEKAKFDTGEADIRALDEHVRQLDEQIKADEAAAEMNKRYSASVKIVSEPEVYHAGPEGRSYFKDLYNARSNGDYEARLRLERNNKVVAEKRSNVGISTSNGAGGEFVPPLWLESDFVRLARPGRITANLTPTQSLPAGTDSINIPKVNTGTAVANQTTQNSQVLVQDLTTTSVASSVVTIAGGQVISLQLLEQSPLNIDEVVLSDLAAAYAVQLNTQVLSGSGAGGQLMGIFTLTGTNAIATGATQDAKTIYAAVANAIQTVHTARYLPPDTIIMHPRRWAMLLAAVDSSNRPLVVPAANSPFNALGNAGEVASQGYVGTLQGLPVYVDALIPTNIGTGTNQDRIIVARMADLILWESHVRAEAFQQTYANNLSVFVRLYNYASFQPARYPKSISVVDGTALVTPTF